MRENDFSQETSADHQHQTDDQRFEVSEPFVLQVHHRDHVQGGDTYAPDQRNLEQQVQQLKVQAYFDLPKARQSGGIYSESAITKALKSTRNQIWQAKYAKKIKGLS